VTPQLAKSTRSTPAKSATVARINVSSVSGREKNAFHVFDLFANFVTLPKFFKKELSTKGLWGTLYTFLRVFSVLFAFQSHRKLLKAVKGPHTKGIFAVYPRVVYRYTLPYLSLNFPRKQRLEMLRSHYQFLNDSLSAPFFQRVLDETLDIWQEKLMGNQFSISIIGPCPHREGDLRLVMKVNETPIYKISFSIIPCRTAEEICKANDCEPSKNLIYIGQVQGYPGAFDLIRESTKICHETAPPDMLMAALAGVAAALDIHVIAGVGFENNLSTPNIANSHATFDYNDFWGRYHGIKSEQGHHIIGLPFFEKEISLVKAKHRKRTLTKRAFKQQINERAKNSMGHMVLNKSAR
jgi:uncharacterized protein VirK/YbjX